MKIGPWPYTASENLAADQGNHVLQYYINIIGIYAAIIGHGRSVWNLSKLNSRHLNFYCKKLTQVEVGYGLLMWLNMLDVE